MIKSSCLLLIKNKKNRIVLFLLMLFSVLYVLVIMPHENADNYDKNQLQQDIKTRESFIANVKKHYPDLSDADTFVQISYDIYPKYISIEKDRIKTFEDSDWENYAQATFDWYDFYWQNPATPDTGFPYDLRFMTYQNSLNVKDYFYFINRNHVIYSGYLTNKQSLSKETFEEKTLIQTLVNLGREILPYLLLGTYLLLIFDIFSNDSNHKTIVNGFPITSIQFCFNKFSTAIFASLLTILALLPAGLFIGFSYGFGSIHQSLSKYVTTEYGIGTHHAMSFSDWLLQFCALYFSWLLFFFLFIFILSFLSSWKLLPLLSSFFILFIENLYYVKGSGFTKPYHYLPSSYMKIGQIIDGYHNYLNSTVQLTFTHSLSIVWIANLIFIFILSLMLHRRYTT